MMPPTSIDGTDITGATIDGTDVTEITVDGDTVFSAGPPPAPVNRLFFVNDVLEVYSLPSKFDLSGNSNLTTISPVNDARGIAIANQGEYLYLGSNGFDGDDRVHRFELTIPYDLTTTTNETTFDPGHEVGDVNVSEDGQYMQTENDASTYEFWELSTPYDMSTATSLETVSYSGTRGSLRYADNGSKFAYISDVNNAELEVFDLTTRFDTDTRGSGTQTNIPGVTPQNGGSFFFSTDGLTFFYITRSGLITEHSLSSPFDLSTISNPIDNISQFGGYSIWLV